MKNTIKYLTILAFSFLLTLSINAQPGDGGFDDEPVDDTPIDGGIILLAGAAAAFGYKKLINYKRK